MPVTIGELLDDAEAQIKACEAIELWRPYMARLEAASLLGFVIGHDPEQSEEVVPAAARRRFDDLIARRLTGEPAALIIGTTTFRGLELRTKPGVFIPAARASRSPGRPSAGCGVAGTPSPSMSPPAAARWPSLWRRQSRRRGSTVSTSPPRPCRSPAPTPSACTSPT